MDYFYGSLIVGVKVIELLMAVGVDVIYKGVIMSKLFIIKFFL